MNDLATQVMDALNEYGQGVAEDVQNAVLAVGKQCAKDIKANARVAFKGNEYYKDWKVKTVDKTSTGLTVVVYSPRHYMLAHLLEHGHAKRGGGRVDGRPHIGPAEEKATKDFEEQIKEIVRKAP